MDGVPLVVEIDRDEPDCATVMVDGTIEGRDYRFILDTGAARTHVVGDPSLAGLPRHGSHRPSGLGGARDDDLLFLPELRVGPLSWTGLEVSTAEGRPDSRNLLGMDAIGTSAGRFDLDGGSWQTAPTGTLPTRWPLARSANGHVFVDVAWPGVTAKAFWDTGAAITVVDSGFLRRNPELFDIAGTAVALDGSGASVEGTTYWMSAAVVGGRTFARHRAFAADLPQALGRIDLVLGYPAIRQAVWVFDFPAGRWAVH